MAAGAVSQKASCERLSSLHVSHYKRSCHGQNCTRACDHQVGNWHVNRQKFLLLYEHFQQMVLIFFQKMQNCKINNFKSKNKYNATAGEYIVQSMHKAKWHHSNLWSQYDLLWGGEHGLVKWWRFFALFE